MSFAPTLQANMIPVSWDRVILYTSVLFAIIFVFVFTVYATSPKIGSFSEMHALLSKASAEQPVAGNAGGSYLTIRSKNGLIFGVINVIGNFATVFQDQAVRTY